MLMFVMGFHPMENVLKWVSLVLLTVQNALNVLVLRYVRVRPGDKFLNTTAIVSGELLKMAVCLLVVLCEQRGLVALGRHLHEEIVLKWTETLKLGVPALLYTLQNNLLFIAVSNLDAGVFQVTYQLKILTTAMFSVLMLRKSLAPLQWLSLGLLMIGVAIVQIENQSASSSASATDQSAFLGLVSVLIACVMSGFAGVYFEKILKATSSSIFVRNIQLSFYGLGFGMAAVLSSDGEKVRAKGFFQGYDLLVWLAIAIYAAGGLLVAVVVKYADNILKGFATSVAIIVSCVASMILFDYVITSKFVLGTVFVIGATFLYGVETPKKADPTPLSPQDASKK